MYGLTPKESIGSLGVTAPANSTTTAQAFGVEFVLTFMLMFAVFAVTDPDRGFSGYEVPLAIGICVFICLIIGVRNLHQITKICTHARSGWLELLAIVPVNSSKTIFFPKLLVSL